jgi:hypothetical protein
MIGGNRVTQSRNGSFAGVISGPVIQH